MACCTASLIVARNVYKIGHCVIPLGYRLAHQPEILFN